jgi:hypothetical protein
VSSAETIERERRWATPAAIGTFLAVGLSLASLILLGSKFGADGNAELLRKINDDSGTLVLIYVIRAVGSALLAVPLVYLFRATEARSEKVRSQLLGLVIAGPLFMAAFAIFTGLSLHDAAPDFVAKHVAGSTSHMDDAAQDAINNASFRSLAAGFGIAGALGFAFAMAYTSLHATRVGLLSRFWGSLGVALGVGSILFPQYTLIWIIYLGLLIAGWVPRGRPPAWDAGEAIAWPTPGEQMAERMGGDETDGGDSGADPDPADPQQPAEPPAQRRKRKRRSDA